MSAQKKFNLSKRKNGIGKIDKSERAYVPKTTINTGFEASIPIFLYMYRYTRYKQLLWFCYGKHIVNSLEKNVVIKKTKFIRCIDCGEWFEVDNMSKSERCEDCQKIYRRAWDRVRKSKKS